MSHDPRIASGLTKFLPSPRRQVQSSSHNLTQSLLFLSMVPPQGLDLVASVIRSSHPVEPWHECMIVVIFLTFPDPEPDPEHRSCSATIIFLSPHLPGSVFEPLT